MQKEIKYIGYYDVDENFAENRSHSLAATNKMDYICKALNKIGYKVLIVSPSRTRSRRFYKGKTIRINDDTALKLFPTFPWGNKFQKAFSLIVGDLILFWYLITKIKRNESILVYHSIGLRSVVRYAKKIKGFKVILEVEEIYQDVITYSKHTQRSEYKAFAGADKYIFAMELLNEKLNPKNKPRVVIYGPYQVEEERKCKFNDGKIHVVYAGTFNSTKGGAAAAAAAAHLPQNYYIHIIGFGNKDETKSIQQLIFEIAKMAECTITYDGLLTGEEYIRFLQSCDIGLSTQILDASYNNTSFPSKILSYMANGLRVVSVRIKAIEISAIGDVIYYYEEQTPEAIAKAIMSIDINQPYNSTELIKRLDEEFVNNIQSLLGG